MHCVYSVIEKNFRGRCYISMEPMATVRTTIENMKRESIYDMNLHRLVPIVLNDSIRAKFNGFFGWREKTSDDWYVYADIDEINRDFDKFKRDTEAETYIEMELRLQNLELQSKKKESSKPKPPDEAINAVATFVKDNPPAGKTTHEYYDLYCSEIRPSLKVAPKDFIKAVKREGYSSVRMENLPNTKKWIINDRPRKSTF